MTFHDLKQAIEKTLRQAKPTKSLGDEIYGGPLQYKVPTKALKILQSEYNIFFVEPEDEQLEVIQ